MNISPSAALRFVSTLAAVTTSVACFDSLKNRRHIENLLKVIKTDFLNATMPEQSGRIIPTNYELPEWSYRPKRSHVAVGLIVAAFIGGGHNSTSISNFKAITISCLTIAIFSLAALIHIYQAHRSNHLTQHINRMQEAELCSIKDSFYLKTGGIHRDHGSKNCCHNSIQMHLGDDLNTIPHKDEKFSFWRTALSTCATYSDLTQYCKKWNEENKSLLAQYDLTEDKKTVLIKITQWMNNS